MSVKHRQELERQIAERIVEDAIKAGYTLDVNDGEEVTVANCSDAKVVMAALMTTDEDYLILHKGSERGWVYLVYGNDGWDVISDYSLNIEVALAGANALSKELEERYA